MSRKLSDEEKALGFLGWHERGYLPHCDFPGLVQFVTYMRDEEQERIAIRYIENNPLKARLCPAAGQWSFSSARFRDEYHRLVLPHRDGAASRQEA